MVWQKKGSKAIDMRFYWLKYWKQEQQLFKTYYAPTNANLVDYYFTKYHSSMPMHHKTAVRHIYIHMKATAILICKGVLES